MKFLEFKRQEDFGQEYHLILFNVNKWCLFQINFDFFDINSPPFAQLSSGNGALISFIAWAGRIGVDFEVISRIWNIEGTDGN